MIELEFHFLWTKEGIFQPSLIQAITVYSKIYYAPDRMIPDEISFDLS